MLLASACKLILHIFAINIHKRYMQFPSISPFAGQDQFDHRRRSGTTEFGARWGRGTESLRGYLWIPMDPCEYLWIPMVFGRCNCMHVNAMSHELGVGKRLSFWAMLVGGAAGMAVLHCLAGWWLCKGYPCEYANNPHTYDPSYMESILESCCWF